jgi:[ribosomal protein S18]-alanine N-acetyltransferase
MTGGETMSVTIRKAKDSDLAQLIGLEEKSFSADRISRRSWRALLRSPLAIIVIAQRQQTLAGAAVVLTRRNSKISRLYSMAVASASRRSGLGNRLLKAAIALARKSGSIEMRLESRTDNSGAHRLFKTVGFVQFGPVVADYYQDGMGAMRFRKQLTRPHASK